MPEPPLAYPNEGDDPSMMTMDDNIADARPSASEVAAPAPEPDRWEQRGYCVIRHARTPRRKLFIPTDDVMNIP
eukprot:2092083-Pyramimonas_sp.AAC.1